MYFLRNRLSYSFETWTIVISTPENLRVCWVWPSKYNGKWCFNPKCVFSEMDHHTALKLVPLKLAHLKTSGCTEFGPLNTKESDVSAQNVYLRNRSSYSIETCIFTICMTENLRVHWVWPSKYNGKWCTFVSALPENPSDVLTPKCVFSEMDHHTALKLVPLQKAHLKTSGCAEFGPLNTMESDVLTQNVFSQKWIIIQLWNLYHCNWHTWKPQGALSLAL